MTFFVLGFRDVLSYLKRKNPQTFWDHTINLHCEEDSNHWLWFIDDLQRIGVRETNWGKDFSELLLTTWSENGFASRDMIYSLVHFAKDTADPMVHLALIESLEAAFAVFINALMPQIEKREWQHELRYFGNHHHEEESNHALGSWVGENDHDQELRKVALTSDQNKQANFVVEEIFSRFNIVFKSWFEQRQNFQGTFVPRTVQPVQDLKMPYQTEQ
jgi:hypothetical protein